MHTPKRSAGGWNEKRITEGNKSHSFIKNGKEKTLFCFSGLFMGIVKVGER